MLPKPLCRLYPCVAAEIERSLLKRTRENGLLQNAKECPNTHRSIRCESLKVNISEEWRFRQHMCSGTKHHMYVGVRHIQLHVRHGWTNLSIKWVEVRHRPSITCQNWTHVTVSATYPVSHAYPGLDTSPASHICVSVLLPQS